MSSNHGRSGQNFGDSRAASVAQAIAFCALLLAAAPVIADEDAEQDHMGILELGVTGEREMSEHAWHTGPAVGIEVEPIENWLEIEFGASTIRSHGATSWELELPFKKPFRLTSTVEIMPGLGPTWTHTVQPGEPPSTWGAEAVLDLFFWRSKRFGWYLEPSYGVNLGNGNKQSAALTGGIFFAIP
jgi:hypothetical protein